MEAEKTREKIKAAAQEVFVQRGYDGARMHEIADRAGANKAMIYYYFNSKETLFEAILRETFHEMMTSVRNLFSVPITDPEEIIPKIVHLHLQFLRDHPHIPQMMVREIHSGNPIVTRVMKQILSEEAQENIEQIARFFFIAKQRKKIRSVDADQIIWNILALNLFYFFTKPMLQTIWPNQCADEDRLLQRREKAIVDLLLYGLLPRPERKMNKEQK